MAALFIFLNKTCFNGLYRVNSKGQFNVPIGSYKKPPICDADNLRLISNLLQNVRIMCRDYSKCEDFIDSNTFVYIDPPYRPLTVTASFTSYSENEFVDKQQIELAGFVEAMNEKTRGLLSARRIQMKYYVTIEETVSQEFEADTNSMEEAMIIIKRKYNACKTVLEPGELVAKQMYARSIDGTDTSEWVEF